ncbi:hypothetical protein CYMTET_22247 [Cymbomonas tetramitiformis]|uniref:Uncharacterized protein n=1 Tax=Cymbomonas tetramitiformis TaxID=36881 RepID=A0AAE0G0S7_9CHLO|nr:hypothetical protein CYMTET_22247 [Cymbomonas tetramitiformis]
MWTESPVPSDEEQVHAATFEYRKLCLAEIGGGRKRAKGQTPVQRLRVAPRPPDVRWIADGAPPGNYHDYTRPMIRASTGKICDYQRGLKPSTQISVMFCPQGRRRVMHLKRVDVTLPYVWMWRSPMCGPGGVRYALHVAAEKGSGL